MTVVLVVDDVAALADQYAFDLRRLGGYEVLTAESGTAALELLGHEAVDCVILDLEMPGMDGFEVLRQLSKRGLHVPVIVYTGTGNYDRCAQAIRQGAASFIDKAESMERVVREVEQALERQRLVREVATLRRERQLADLVQEQQAAGRRFKRAFARGDGAGEGSALVAKQLTLDQLLRQGGAIDRNERGFARGAAEALQLARHHLLSGAGFAQ